MKLSSRGVILLPSAFTAGNIFCGFYSLIQSYRGDYYTASFLVICAGLLDFFDGKVARFSGTESSFGVEFDSLADIISFGIAPAFLLYSVYLQSGGEWSWLISFIYVLCGALRLARFNVETKGGEKSEFKGLPIPIAASFLVTLPVFFQQPYTVAFVDRINIGRVTALAMLAVSALMISRVSFSASPRYKTSSVKSTIIVTIFIIYSFVMFFNWSHLVFPFCSIYILWGTLRALFYAFKARISHTQET